MPKKNIRVDSVVTTGGSDGACSAAAVLCAFEKAQVFITSQNVVHHALARHISLDPRPREVLVCGVGIKDDIYEEVISALKELEDAGIRVTWLCGRGYLDDKEKRLSAVCKTIFENAPSNTAVVVRRLGLEKHERIDLLLTLGRQYAEGKRGRKEHEFWHNYLQAGSDRYFQFGDLESFIMRLRKLAGHYALTSADQEEVELFEDKGGKAPAMLGTSKAMDELRETLSKVAMLEEPVLLLGPSGCGKELAARAVHDGSQQRKGGPFLPVNCAVIGASVELASDKLFGHVKGAFTGADKSAQGAFEAAAGGSLFLDEVAELPVAVQTQLLRVLQEHKISPVGSTESRPVDVRVIAATNRDLGSMVEKGEFRSDLLFRLGVFPVRVPAFTERLEDARAIAQTVIAGLGMQGHGFRMTRRDWQAVREYDWPGNIRQFINCIKRAACLEKSFHQVVDDERHMGWPVGQRDDTSEEKLRLFLPSSPEKARPFEDIRRAYFRHVLSLCDGNYTRAKDLLGVSDNTLRKWTR